MVLTLKSLSGRLFISTLFSFFFSSRFCRFFIWNVFLFLLILPNSLCLFLCVRYVPDLREVALCRKSLWGTTACTCLYIISMCFRGALLLNTANYCECTSRWDWPEPGWLPDSASCGGCQPTGGQDQVLQQLAEGPRSTWAGVVSTVSRARSLCNNFGTQRGLRLVLSCWWVGNPLVLISYREISKVAMLAQFSHGRMSSQNGW